MYFACLSGCLFVYLYPINVKTAEMIGPKFCVGPHVAPVKVVENVKNLPRFSLNFWTFWKSAKFFDEIHELFCFVVHKENGFTIKIGDVREAP